VRGEVKGLVKATEELGVAAAGKLTLWVPYYEGGTNMRGPS